MKYKSRRDQIKLSGPESKFASLKRYIPADLTLISNTMTMLEACVTDCNEKLNDTTDPLGKDLRESHQAYLERRERQLAVLAQAFELMVYLDPPVTSYESLRQLNYETSSLDD